MIKNNVLNLYKKTIFSIPLKTFFWIFINKINFLLLRRIFQKYYFIKTYLLNYSSYLNKKIYLFNIPHNE